MHKRNMTKSAAIIAACFPAITSIVASAQTVIFSENFDGPTGGNNKFLMQLTGGDGTFDANYDYSQFQYKLYPNPSDLNTFTSQPIPAAPGGTTTKGLRISVDDTSGATSHLQLLAQDGAGHNISIGNNFKITYDIWMNYAGPQSGGDFNSTEFAGAGINTDGSGTVGYAPTGSKANGFMMAVDGEGGTTSDYRGYYTDSNDDGRSFASLNQNWTGVSEQGFDLSTGSLNGGGETDPDNASNSYHQQMFPAGTYETPGAPGKHWVSATIEQHGNIVDYSLNGQHISSLFLLGGPTTGVPTFGYFDPTAGNAGSFDADEFVIYDNIAVTQFAASSQFTATSGNFSDSTKWSGPVPSGNTQDAVFNGASAPATVNVTTPVTLRSLVFNSTNSYTVSGAGTINLTAETNDLVTNAGSHTVTAPVSVTGHLSVFTDTNTTLTMTHLATDPTKYFDKTGNGTFAVNKIQALGLEATGGVVQLLPNGGTSRVNGIDLGNSSEVAALDITNNAMIVDYVPRIDPDDPTDTASPFTNTYGEILLGYNGGDWKPALGSSALIISSTAADVASSGNTHKTGIGYAEASDVLGPNGGTFNGQSVDASAVLIKYTYLGDANLDGTVNALDFNALATNYGSPNLPYWSQGDFNYDGVVDSSDFDALAANYNLVMPSSGAVPFASALVPEPVTAGALIFSGILLRRSRRI